MLACVSGCTTAACRARSRNPLFAGPRSAPSLLMAPPSRHRLAGGATRNAQSELQSWRRSGAAATGRRRQMRVGVVAFSLAKNLGLSKLSKPKWVPDLGLAKRAAVLDVFFGISEPGSPLRHEVFEELLAPDFKMREDLRHDAHPRTYFRADFIELMDAVARAIPDFSWSAATDAEVDADGYAIVEVKVSGHHTGEPFELPGLPAVPPSGRRVSLETEFMRVKVASERIKEIVVLPSEGAGPLALYKALGGTEPPQSAAV